MTPTETVRPHLDRVQNLAAVIGLGGLAACAVGGFLSPAQFFHSYLHAYLFWTGLAVGSCGVLMLHHMVGGRWGMAIRRVLESSTRTLPLIALLVLPVLFGMHHLYEWTHADVVAKDQVLQFKQPYLNAPFFIARTVLYFAIWIGLALLLNRYSVEQDTAADKTGATRRLVAISGPGLILYALTVTFASIDWVMSMEPHWFSTMYGVIFMVAQGLSTFAFSVAVVILLARRGPFASVLSTNVLHDLGNLMFAFTMLWAYVNFSQFLIIWSGNLAEEVPWYLRRINHGWGVVAILLVIFHFAVPFTILLLRDVKRRADRLIKVAIAIIVMRFIDLFWLVEPAHHHDALTVHWMNFAAPVGIGGLWIAAFLWQLKRRPLVPVNDPRIKPEVHHHA
jgi:hypothetical protein